MNPLVPLFCDPNVWGGRLERTHTCIHTYTNTHTHTHTQTKYSNPHCTWAQRVNYRLWYICDRLWYRCDRLWYRCDRLWYRCDRLWYRCDKLWYRCDRLWYRCDRLWYRCDKCDISSVHKTSKGKPGQHVPLPPSLPPPSSLPTPPPPSLHLPPSLLLLPPSFILTHSSPYPTAMSSCCNAGIWTLTSAPPHTTS